MALSDDKLDELAALPASIKIKTVCVRDLANELFAARELIEAYETREEANHMNRTVGSKMVAADVLREKKRAYEEARR